MSINKFNIYSQRKTKTNNSISSIRTQSNNAVHFKGVVNEVEEKSAPIIAILKKKLIDFMASLNSDKNISDLMAASPNKKIINLEYQILGEQEEKFVRKVTFYPDQRFAYIKDISTNDNRHSRDAIDYSPLTKKARFASVATPTEGMIHTTNGLEYHIRESKELGRKSYDGKL